MMGMEGLPAILFGSEQNARGRRGPGISHLSPGTTSLQHEAMQSSDLAA